MSIKKLHIHMGSTRYACSCRRGKNGGYHGVLTVWDGKKRIYSESSLVESLSPYDAQENAKKIAEDLHFQNGGTMAQWKNGEAAID